VTTPHDIAIVGGGPAGLSFARALAGTGLSIAIVEQQEQGALADPAYDGREIALTRRSIRALADLGAWALIPGDEVSALKEARILNGSSPLALSFDTAGHPGQALGMLVSNHLIRRALFECVEQQPEVTLTPGTRVVEARATSSGAFLTLSNGEELTARLLVAADSRFSSIRQALGIDAEMNRLGKAMLVCRVSHECDHGQVATEWFGHGQTFAMLPLNGRQSSAVVTLPIAEAERLAALDEDVLGWELSGRYSYRLGKMHVASSRHVYPLVTTCAKKFVAPGAALIGDTAVGMHPVTAHGFNLGLGSAVTLAKLIREALGSGIDWSDQGILRRYELRHRRASLPLYRATNLIVRLYNDERLPARFARGAAIRLGRRLPIVRGAVRSMLLHA
jgi:ubiquinone biosynthesis UbiH/UbiF/VisC/COQ6 family hydroxylase